MLKVYRCQLESVPKMRNFKINRMLMEDMPTIFYADDDEDDIMVFTEAAEKLDVSVASFLLGEAMLDAIYNPPPEPAIIFIDLNMPGKSGFELIKEIKSSPFCKHIPVVVLSTASDPRSVNLAKRTGADYFITKPNSRNELQDAIRHALSIDWQTYQPSQSGFHHFASNAFKSASK